MSASESELDRLVEAIRESGKYRNVSEDLIRRIGAGELTKVKNYKAAEKATRNKLHQIAAAYFPLKARYADWLEEIRAAGQTNSPNARREACLRIMGHHASTRERLPELEDFYSTVFARLPPVHSVLDIGCGFNPLAIPWMPLAEGARYTACDVYHDLADFLNGFFQAMDISGEALACDVLSTCPADEVDLALLLKILPPLEQLEKGAGLRLIRALPAQSILVTFPCQSLGGRNKGMAEHYENRFLESIQDEHWQVEQFTFKTEIAFLLKTGSIHG